MPTASARTYRDKERELPPREVAGEVTTNLVGPLGYVQYLVDGIPVNPDSLIYDLEPANDEDARPQPARSNPHRGHPQEG